MIDDSDGWHGTLPLVLPWEAWYKYVSPTGLYLPVRRTISLENRDKLVNVVQQLPNATASIKGAMSD